MDLKKWTLRNQPLKPSGAMFSMEQNVQLYEWVIKASDEQLSNLKGVYTDQCIIVIGDEKSLPWWPGCTYLGQDELAPHIYIPTYARPPYSIDLIEKSILNQYGQGLYVIELKHHWVIPLIGARPLHRETVLAVVS